MNILITGGTGFVGQQLVIKLFNENHNITVLTRSNEKAKRLFAQPIKFTESLDDINFNQLDVVINLAGEGIADKKWTHEQKEEICKSRWVLTRALANKIDAAQTPPTCFISGSAIGYYGRQDEITITEDFQNIHQEFTHDVCKTWESIALSCQERTRVCILRTGIVLGNNGGALKKMLLPFKLGLGGRIANGAQYMSWIHMEDITSIILTLMNNQQSQGIYNVTAPHAVTNKEFSQNLSLVLKRPCIFPMPESILKVLLGEMSELLIYGQNVYPERLINEGFVFSYPTLNEALTNILSHKN